MGASSCHVEHLCGMGPSAWGAGGHQEMRHGSGRENYGTSGTFAGTGPAGADMMPNTVRLKDPALAGASAADAGGGSRHRPGGLDPRTGLDSSSCRPSRDQGSVAGKEAGDGCPLIMSYLNHEAEELKSLSLFGGGPLVRSRMRHCFKTGAIYDGQWLGNARDGFGIQRWPDGAEYVGEWRQNVATGRGRFVHYDGDVYIGEWMKNLPNGTGTYSLKNGLVYRGLFAEDLQHGFGTETWADGSMFAGAFVDGKKNGEGVYQWPDGSQYQGQWSQNHLDGFGIYTGADGRHFRGRWHFSRMHGSGRYHWVDDRCYEGQYVWDQKDGFGVFTWPDGRKYVGYWEGGRQHGIGRLCNASGSTRLAKWSGGERVEWLEDPGGDPSAHVGSGAEWAVNTPTNAGARSGV